MRKKGKLPGSLLICVHLRPSAVTSLVKGGPARLIARCEFISETAARKLEFLAEQNITEATLTALDEKIAAARTAAGLPRAYTVDRSAANKELRNLRRKGNTILRSRIDKMMLQFRDSDTEFYAKFKAARRIVNSPTTSSNHQASVSLTGGRNGNGTTAGELVPEVTR